MYADIGHSVTIFQFPIYPTDSHK